MKKENIKINMERKEELIIALEMGRKYTQTFNVF